MQLKEKINNSLIMKNHLLKVENKILLKRLNEKQDIEKKYIDKINELKRELREVKLSDKKYYDNR